MTGPGIKLPSNGALNEAKEVCRGIADSGGVATGGPFIEHRLLYVDGQLEEGDERTGLLLRPKS